MTRVSLASKCCHPQVVPTEEGNGQPRSDTREGRGRGSQLRGMANRDSWEKQVATAKAKLKKDVISGYLSERNERKRALGTIAHALAGVCLLFATIFPGMWTEYNHDLGQYPLALGIADNHHCRVIADHLKADPHYYGSRPFLNMTVAQEMMLNIVHSNHLVSLLIAFSGLSLGGIYFFCRYFRLPADEPRAISVFRLLFPTILDLGSVAFIVPLMIDFPDDCPLPQFTKLTFLAGMGLYSLACILLCVVALACIGGALQAIYVRTERGLDDYEWYYLWNVRHRYGDRTDRTDAEVAEVVVERGASQS